MINNRESLLLSASLFLVFGALTLQIEASPAFEPKKTKAVVSELDLECQMIVLTNSTDGGAYAVEISINNLSTNKAFDMQVWREIFATFKVSIYDNMGTCLSKPNWIETPNPTFDAVQIPPLRHKTWRILLRDRLAQALPTDRLPSSRIHVSILLQFDPRKRVMLYDMDVLLTARALAETPE